MVGPLRETLDVTANEAPEVKAAAARAPTTESIRAAIGGPLSKEVGLLWTLVVGLVAIHLMALGHYLYCRRWNQ
jgi:hypothetical protein